ncbi:hypothetical protein [Streptomyces atroolivaceus]|uniref:Lipoprotein n=1 Tax=Streptomyces atroolivaceus TaxID=66869 RepID=A0ABV9V9Y6_STRAZ|nr:hypothetical protein [Streptomyces atroolivaceus]
MCTRIAAVFTVGLILATLTGCSSSDREDTTVDASKAVVTPKTPLYTVVNKVEKSKVGSVDLVIPNATVEEAKAAIRDYAKTIDGQLNYGINVIRDKDDMGIEDYVCHGEWVIDEQAARAYTGGRVTSDTWPAIGWYCSNPKQA